MTRRPIIAGLSPLLVVAGCTTGPDHVRPDPPQSRAIESARFLRAGSADAVEPAADWWSALGDAVLSGLVEQGLESAPSIAAMRARVRQARAGVDASRAALLPMLSASGTYVYADLPNQAFGTGGGTEFVSLGFDAQWEADLWGGKRRDVERAVADAGAAEARFADAQVSLSAEIARTYIGLQARREAERLVEERRQHENRIARLAASRLRGGTGTGQELAHARGRLAGTRAELAALQAEQSVLLDSLATLVGVAPGELDPVPDAAIPLPPARVEIGDPAALLARRPDVLAAERALAGATASVGVAKARRFPAVSLLGLIGVGGEDFGDLFESSQLAGLAVPSLTWNFLDFGRTAAGIERAEAGREAASAIYRQQVLAALRDAEAALARFGAARVAYGEAGEMAQLAQEAHRLHAMRAEAGALSLMDALAARREAIDARLAEANRRASLTLAYVTLAKSLGLGWQEGPEPASKD